MLDYTKLSSKYLVRRMSERDAERILALCSGNSLFYQYAKAVPTLEQVLEDLRITPPGIDAKDKYYLGFFDGETLIAVMDLTDGYPNHETAFIGFFMVDAAFQGWGTGSFIISETADYLRRIGKTAIRLGIDAGNPQSNAFWRKNGFITIAEVDKGDNTILLAEKTLIDGQIVL